MGPTVPALTFPQGRHFDAFAADFFNCYCNVSVCQDTTTNGIITRRAHASRKEAKHDICSAYQMDAVWCAQFLQTAKRSNIHAYYNKSEVLFCRTYCGNLPSVALRSSRWFHCTSMQILAKEDSFRCDGSNSRVDMRTLEGFSQAFTGIKSTYTYATCRARRELVGHAPLPSHYMRSLLRDSPPEIVLSSKLSVPAQS